MGFVKNAWYVIASTREVGRTLLRRMVMDQSILLYRKIDGGAVALLDRCSHRFAPLSRGKLVGDHVQCAYHGLQYDCTGKCTHNPHGTEPPRGAVVRAFPTAERYGFVWIWMGDAQRADMALVPDLRPFDSPENLTHGGYISIPADYRLVVDNLLDLSHVEFLHPSFAAEGALEDTRYEVVEEAGMVHSNRWKPNCAVSPMLRRLWNNAHDRGDARSCIRWQAPSNLLHDLGVTALGEPIENGVTVTLLHLLTPATQDLTHYFWAIAWDAKIDSPGLSEWLGKILMEAFEREDEPMIAAQQREIGHGVDLMSLGPVLMASDLAAVKARRILNRHLEAERDMKQMNN